VTSSTHRRLVLANWALWALTVALAGGIFMLVPLFEPPAFLASHPSIHDAGDQVTAAPHVYPSWGLAVLRDPGGLYAVALPSPCPCPRLASGGGTLRCGSSTLGVATLPHLLVWVSGRHTYVDAAHRAEPAYRATAGP
jgi:hypothetical protein